MQLQINSKIFGYKPLREILQKNLKSQFSVDTGNYNKRNYNRSYDQNTIKPKSLQVDLAFINIIINGQISLKLLVAFT